jgi:hypothetical protein
LQDGLISLQKYRPFGKTARKIIESLDPNIDQRYISAAYAENTWKRVNASKNCLKKFAQETQTHIAWPLNSNTTLHLTNWALSKKGLSHSTVTAYLNNISLIYKLKEVDNSACNTFPNKDDVKRRRKSGNVRKRR